MRTSKKTQILKDWFHSCKHTGDILQFSTNEIKELSLKYKFKNPYDVTKIDNEKVLPEEMIKSGFTLFLYDKHATIVIREKGFKEFPNNSETIQISIPKNPFYKTKCCSENSCVMYLPKLLSDFLGTRTELYTGIFGRQRNVQVNVCFDDNESIQVSTNQIDIDMTYYFTENNKKYIIYCELKRSRNKSFNVNQLYHCLKYNEYICKSNKEYYTPILLMVKSYDDVTQISQYNFMNKNKPWSISCEKSKTYQIEYD